ncbi:hypothetical protein O6H91_01G014100 [Diphasiastrum complanatum]|uniref:Uncharacterized protein n=1 Tax=Diphasiastrum complanatum TaxID=34168 RepID=A0ACC2ENB7_DIPCM|nr:hypothetical protein O6H91_01G014100 [Diphasiastrum complanatum]
MPQSSDIRTAAKASLARSENGLMEQPSHVSEDNGNILVLPEQDFSKQLEGSATLDVLSLEKKDRSALLNHISSLQKELYDYQYQMGLLLVECKNWGPRYDKLKVAVSETEENWQREETMHAKALDDTKKREEALKQSLEIEKQCIVDLEKALKEMQLEVAEGREAAGKQLSQARILVNEAEEKSLLAESKLHSAEALHAEASRKLAETERKLQEIEAREDALRREQHKLNAEYEARKGDLDTDEENLQNWEKRLQEGQDRLRQGEKLLNNREEYVYEKEEALKHLEKTIKDERVSLEKEHSRLRQEEADLNAQMAAISLREKTTIEREVSLDKKEQELLIFQERLVNREHFHVFQVMEKHEREVEDKEASLAEERKKLECARISLQQMEDSINGEKKQLAAMTKVLDGKNKDLSTREEELQEKAADLVKLHQNYLIEQEDLDKTKHSLAAREADINKLHEIVHKEKEQCLEERDKLKEREKDLDEMLKQVASKEHDFADEKRQFMIEKEELEQRVSLLYKQRDEVEEMKKELELEKKQLLEEKMQLEVIKQEREDILKVQVQLKEEIDSLRGCKHDVQHEAEELKVEKERFEKQWEFLDEKKEQMRKDEEDLKQERKKFAKWIQDEEARLKDEKRELWQQIQKESELLNSEKRAFVLSMEMEKADLFTKIQKEREELARDVELRGAELERCLEKRRMEVERKSEELELKLEETLRKEKLDLQLMKENAQEEMEFVLKEKHKLEKEKEEILNQREKLEPERCEIKGDIMELQIQREKLMEQREALHREKQELMQEAERLKRLRHEVKQVDDSLLNSEQVSHRDINEGEVLSPQRVARDRALQNEGAEEKDRFPDSAEGTSGKALFGNAVTPGRLSWLQKCASIFYQPSSEVKVKPSSGKGLLGNTWAANKVQLNEHVGDLQDKPDHDESFSFYLGNENGRTADKEPKPKAKSMSSRGTRGTSTTKFNPRRKRSNSIKAVIEDARKILEPLKLGQEFEEDIQQERQPVDSRLSESEDPLFGQGQGLQVAVDFTEAGASIQEESLEPTNVSNREQQEVKSGRKRVRSVSCATSEQESEGHTAASQRVGGKKRRQRETLVVDSPAGDDISGTPGAKRYNFRNSTIASMMASQVATLEDKELGTVKAISKGSERTHEEFLQDSLEISSVEPHIHESLHNLPEMQTAEKFGEAEDFRGSQEKENLIGVVALQVVLDGSVSPVEENLVKVDDGEAHSGSLKKDSQQKDELIERNETSYEDTGSEEEEDDDDNEESHENHIHHLKDDEEDVEEESQEQEDDEESQEQEDEEIVLENVHSPLQKIWHFLST